MMKVRRPLLRTVILALLIGSVLFMGQAAAADDLPLNDAVGPYCSQQQFTTVDTTPPAAIADLVALTAYPNVTSIELDWTAPGDDGNSGTASTYDIRYSMSPIDAGNWDSATLCINDMTPRPAGTPEAFTVTGLSSNTIYYFAIKTADEVPNWSDLSNVALASTGSNTPPNAPTFPLCEGVPNPTGVTDPTPEFSWTFSDPDGGDTQGAYQILVASTPGNLASDNGDMWDSGQIFSTASEVSYDGTPLTENKEYYWKVKTWDNNDAVGPYCDQQQFTTGDITPPAAVNDLTAYPNVTSMELNWTAPGDDGNSGTASTYDIRYSMSLIDAGNWGSATVCINGMTPSPAGNPEAFTVTGLSSNTTYYFAIKTADEVPNWSGLSNVASGTTGNSPPVLSNGAVSPTSGYASTTFTYSVTYTDAENDAPSSLTVSIDGGTPAAMTTKTGEDGDYTNGEIYEYTATGTELGLGTHNFQFAASDGIDNATGDTEPHSGPTVSSPPSPGPVGPSWMPDTKAPVISNIECCDITKTSVIIKWKTSERGTSRVEYWASEHTFTPLDERLVIDHEVELTGLYPCTLYHYCVISKDRSDNEAISEEDTFTTLGTPATFKLSALSIFPGEVITGETITISVVVSNTGDGSGTYEATFKLDDVAVTTKEVALTGGTSQEITFVTSADVAGTYTLTVNGQSGTVVVKTPPPTPVPPPAPPPPPVPTPPPVPPVSPPPEAPINWPLIGGIIAGSVAAGLLVYFRVWRKRRVSRPT